MLANHRNSWPGSQLASRPHVTQVLGLFGIMGFPHTPARFPHPPTPPVPRCWLKCGQLLTRHFDALLERPVPHHLSLDLVH